MTIGGIRLAPDTRNILRLQRFFRSKVFRPRHAAIPEISFARAAFLTRRVHDEHNERPRHARGSNAGFILQSFRFAPSL